MEKRLGQEPWIGVHCTFDRASFGVYTEVGAYNRFENVTLGDYSYTGEYCILQNTVVGKFANIAAMVRIGPTAHPMDRPTLHHITYRRRMYGVGERDDEAFLGWRSDQTTWIGHDTWIGHGAIIMPGVRIGNGSIVGSGAVVTKDVEPYTIVAGVPANIIRRRFSVEIADRLERIAWWDWPHDTLAARIDELCMNVEHFIETYEPRTPFEFS